MKFRKTTQFLRLIETKKSCRCPTFCTLNSPTKMFNISQILILSVYVKMYGSFFYTKISNFIAPASRIQGKDPNSMFKSEYVYTNNVKRINQLK